MVARSRYFLYHYRRPTDQLDISKPRNVSNDRETISFNGCDKVKLNVNISRIYYGL